MTKPKPKINIRILKQTKHNSIIFNAKNEFNIDSLKTVAQEFKQVEEYLRLNFGIVDVRLGLPNFFHIVEILNISKKNKTKFYFTVKRCKE